MYTHIHIHKYSKYSIVQSGPSSSNTILIFWVSCVDKILNKNGILETELIKANNDETGNTLKGKIYA